MFDTDSPDTGDAGAAAAPGTESGQLDTGLTHPREDTALLTVDGEVDTLTAPLLDAALARLVDQPRPVLVVDLVEVTFLASSGLAVLIRAAHAAAESDRRLQLVVRGRPVRRPLEITGTDQLFDLHADRESALAPPPTS